jgi:hypothetical protein
VTTNPIHLRRYLADIEYPTDKATVIAAAVRAGAHSELLEALRGMKSQRFTCPTDVREALSYK